MIKKAGIVHHQSDRRVAVCRGVAEAFEGSSDTYTDGWIITAATTPVARYIASCVSKFHIQVVGIASLRRIYLRQELYCSFPFEFSCNSIILIVTDKFHIIFIESLNFGQMWSSFSELVVSVVGDGMKKVLFLTDDFLKFIVIGKFQLD